MTWVFHPLTYENSPDAKYSAPTRVQERDASFEGKEGTVFRRVIDASSVGPDLARSTAVVTRTSKPKDDNGTAPRFEEYEPATADATEPEPTGSLCGLSRDDVDAEPAAAERLRAAGIQQLPYVQLPDGDSWTGLRLDRIVDVRRAHLAAA